MILIYIPCKDALEAEALATTLLEKHLIACANMFPSTSMYWWKKKLQKSTETVIIAKTSGHHYPKIESLVQRLHSYECPCILKIPVEGNEQFVKWVEKEVSP